jgi:hypothetical protein
LKLFFSAHRRITRLRSLPWLIAGLLLYFAGAPVASAQHKKPSASWKGRSAGFTISMTPSRFLISTSTGKPVLDSAAIFASNYKELRKTPDCPGGIHLEQYYRLLSVVGPFVSFEYKYYIGCLDKDGTELGAHPAMGRTYFSLDCRNPGKNLAKRICDEQTTAAPFSVLDKIFPPDQLRPALTKSFDVDVDKTGKMNFTQFRKYVSENLCQCVDPCTSMAFSKVVADSVIVNVGIGGSGASHGSMQETPLALPLPLKYKSDFELARSSKSGFLESNRPFPLRSLRTVVERER